MYLCYIYSRVYSLYSVYKKSIAFQIQIQINDNYKWFDRSQLLWVNDTRRKHVLFKKEINYNFILMLLVLPRVYFIVIVDIELFVHIP
jgi:hypothetical protein